ncbi:MAG TPA: ABC transporter substrate-binding protein, partial [Burkholderiaceae bacterium]|nr:ABC transporter substrate-binding protein [Burkholderiaceae bacterium]
MRISRIFRMIAFAAGMTAGGTALASGGTLVVLQPAVARHLNSAVQSGTATGIPASQVFASPLRYDGDGDWEPKPYLAESWSFQDDGMSLLLKLVPNAVFHDGKPITSEDVAFSIMAVKEHHPFQSMFAPVVRVDTPSPQIAILRFSQPHPAILLALSPAFAPVLPKHVYGDGQDLKTHPRNAMPVGSGPYKVVEFKPSEHIIMEKHQDFFIKGRPKFDRLVFKVVQDPAAIVLAFERKEAHYLPWLSSVTVAEQLKRFQHLEVSNRGAEAIGPLGWLAFNLQRKPYDDVRVRKAISYAIDREFIISKLHRGLTKPATGPIAPGTPFYTDKVERYKLDLAKATRLLDEAGLKPDAQGVRLRMQIDYLPNTPDNSQTVAEFLRSQLKKIGVEATVRAQPDFPTWAKRVSNHDFDVTMDGSFNYGDPVIGVHRTYLSSNIRKGVIWSNTQNYVNPKVDDLLAKATVERDPAKRKALYHEFQRIV